MLEQVYENVYREYAPKVRGYLYNRINSRDDADDIFQDIFKDFWKAQGKFRGDAKPSTLLYVIMKRRFTDYLRAKYRTIHLKAKYRHPNSQYVKEIEDILNIPVNPLNILIAVSQGETKSLLLAIKRTRERTS